MPNQLGKASLVFVSGLLLIALSSPVHATPIIIESTFDTSLEGWTTNDSGIFTQRPAGGNPGGYLFLDNCECTIAQILAPATFLGDLSAYVGGTFSFDGNLLGNGGSFFDGPNGIPGGVYLDYGIVQIIGPSISAQVDLLPNGATAPLDSWQTYSVALNAATWGLSQSDFLTLMQNVTSLRITVEGLWGAEQEGIDNVRLQGVGGPSVVPEPASLILLGSGLAGLELRRRSYNRRKSLRSR